MIVSHRNDPEESHAVSGVGCYTHQGGHHAASDNVFHESTTDKGEQDWKIVGRTVLVTLFEDKSDHCHFPVVGDCVCGG